jgi:hypothetical protein
VLPAFEQCRPAFACHEVSVALPRSDSRAATILTTVPSFATLHSQFFVEMVGIDVVVSDGQSRENLAR